MLRNKFSWLMTSILLFTSSTLALPPNEEGAKERLETSPRHGEYVDVPLAEGKSIRAYVVYPEVKDKAPVVIVIHEIFGLSDWIKSVTDELAADGFIAIAPDFLSGRGPDGGATESFAGRDELTQAVRAISADDVDAILNATRAYATKLPAATDKFGVIGFCWGGAQSFRYAGTQPELGAAVIYYGTSPSDASVYEKITAPIQGHYGSDDARVNATIPDAEKNMGEHRKTFEPHIYEGAGHGFLRQQSGRDGANLKASEAAWPSTIAFLKQHLIVK